MQLWIGLGNPGVKYAHNRHNAGFLFVDALADACRAPGWSKKFNALITEIEISIQAVIPAKAGSSGNMCETPALASPVSASLRLAGVTANKAQKIILIKPQQFMNRSGQAVGEAMRFYKLTPADITVFHDELDLPFGKLRVKTGGGHGGHNGLRDIDAHIGKNYRRVRLGIDHPGDKNLVSDYVLSDFTGSQRKDFEEWLNILVVAVPLLTAGKDAEFMTRVAR